MAGGHRKFHPHGIDIDYPEQPEHTRRDVRNVARGGTLNSRCVVSSNRKVISLSLLQARNRGGCAVPHINLIGVNSLFSAVVEEITGCRQTLRGVPRQTHILGALSIAKTKKQSEHKYS